MGWVVALVVFALLGLELSARLLLAWYTRRSGRLVASLSEFVDALGKFNHVYGDSLTLVKRAELASRGYRLGTGLLPPIGRLEANNAETSAGDESQDTTKEDIVDEQAPSLLLTALAKQRSRAILLLETAEAWSSYDNAVSVLTVRDDAQGSDVAETETDNASVPTTEDPDCTVVFTGTSTGDEGFDLQALLNQQEADTASSAAKPHFVRELRDVLAHRQAHAQPANAFNMELRALLQRAQQSQQGDVIECLGESDEETEPDEINAREKLATPVLPLPSATRPDYVSRRIESWHKGYVSGELLDVSTSLPLGPQAAFRRKLLLVLALQLLGVWVAVGLATFYPPVRDRVIPFFTKYNPLLLCVSAVLTFTLLGVLYVHRTRRAAEAATFVGLGVSFDTHIGFFNCGATFTWVMLMCHLISPLIAGALAFAAVVSASALLFMIYGTQFVTSAAFGYSLAFQFIMLGWFAWDATCMFDVIAADEFAHGVIYIYTDIVLSFLFSVALAGVALGFSSLLKHKKSDTSRTGD
uniref:Myosin-binding domain-containing protein n=1 Tax=Phytophthora ramorum TaxID=164328 RepID=H3HB07_PHYRM